MLIMLRGLMNRAAELIDGVVYMMESPSQTHQEISGAIHWQLYNFLRGKPCKVFHAPFDVCLDVETTANTVCQPDLLVVCDAGKLDGKCCKGAPDMVIEITSPSTASYDRLTKFNKYLRAGVREYWIIDPDMKMVSVHVLSNGQYILHPYGKDSSVPVHILKGCVIELSEVFLEDV